MEPKTILNVVIIVLLIIVSFASIKAYRQLKQVKKNNKIIEKQRRELANALRLESLKLRLCKKALMKKK